MYPFIQIDWHEGYANMPDLLVHEHLVPFAEFVFEQRGDLYYACDERTGQVKYFSYNGPGGGYGGHKFTINMKDGTTKTLIGPWSSRASVMNGAGFPHCVEVVYVDHNRNRLSGAMLITRAKELLANSGLGAVYVDGREHGYDIVAATTDVFCYQCHKNAVWLAPDSRCGECTRYTPDEVING